MSILIFTDGASKGNPGPGGWGAILVLARQNARKQGTGNKKHEVVELGGFKKNTTNNRMELTAVIEALSYLTKNSEPKKLKLFTDSSYVIKGAGWISKWEKTGWIGANKKKIFNKDLWLKLGKLLKKVEIKWQLFPGHSGIAGNERSDRIASDFADGKKVSLYKGDLNSYSVSILDLSYDKTKKKTKKNRSRSSAKGYSYLSMVRGVIKIHPNWEECKARVHGVSGAKFKKALHAEDEKKIISEWENR